jgi:hypothetical protein
MPTELNTRLREAENRAHQLEGAFAAVRVLREANIPATPQARRLLVELAALPDQEAMRRHVASSQAGALERAGVPLMPEASSGRPALRESAPLQESVTLAEAGIPLHGDGADESVRLRESTANDLAQAGIPLLDSAPALATHLRESSPAASALDGIPMLPAPAGQRRVKLTESVGGGVIRRIS